MKEELIELMRLSEKNRNYCESIEKKIELGINFGNIVSVTTDGAPIIIWKHTRFEKLMKQEVSHIFVDFHYIIYQKALCAKSTFKSLENVIGLVTEL